MRHCCRGGIAVIEVARPFFVRLRGVRSMLTSNLLLCSKDSKFAQCAGKSGISRRTKR